MTIENNIVITYFEELLKVYKSDHTIKDKYRRFRILLDRITKKITREESLQFSNLFSRLSFVCEKQSLSKRIHGVRITSNKVLKESYIPSQNEYETHFKYLSDFIAEAFGVAVPKELIQIYPLIEYQAKKENSKKRRIERLRAEIVSIHNDKLICIEDKNQADEYITVKFDYFEEHLDVKDFWKGAQLYLVNIEIDEFNEYFPKFIILEPDYLVDVSSIAECFQDYGKTELFYMKSKFEEVPNSKHIRLGNFANLVVDELLAENENEVISFKNIIKKDFQTYPFEYTICEDLKTTEKFKEYIVNAELQFENIKKVITNDFIKNDISIENALLEPSFLCELYGIQGRLDILELSSTNKHQKIIELKSGGAPFPDDGTSIKPNHRAQLYLYYQLIALLQKIDFHKISTKIDGYILYSKVSDHNLRYNKPSLAQIQSVFNIRNSIITNEYYLTLDDIAITKEIINKITPNSLINSANVTKNFREKYLEPQIKKVMKPITGMSEIEEHYFYSFVSFIAKEQYLTKIGDSDNPNHQGNGLANLWLNSFIEKKEKFEILYDLEISKNLIDKEEKEITLSRKNKENEFVNFRKGDTCILYPRNNDDDLVTTNQIFKCNIKKLSKKEVILSFRYQQSNTKYFEGFDKWALEKDSMDSSFRAMYKNLYTFISSSKKKRRELILTTAKPVKGNSVAYDNRDFSDEQNRILNKALSAKNYFLLNGPPGTGKTSIILRELVSELYKKDETNILLLAYTNRAVDEICETVNNAIINFDDVNDSNVNRGRSDRNFIRIGNELSCSQQHKHNLLSNISKNTATRKDLKEILQKHRIYVSTVASMASKMELFKLKKFDTVIVDEASQILEPQIIGLLQKCEKFILIGDHKQLPAIVLQSKESSKTKSEVLKNIGLQSRKNSLFERLYKFCENNTLEFAFDELTYQGRMHKEIALFPNHTFYDSKLKQAFDRPNLKPEDQKKLKRQDIPLNFISKSQNTLTQILAKKRIAFFSSVHSSSKKDYFNKCNDFEAKKVVEIISRIKKLYDVNNKPYDTAKTIGVIAPFRNQIALIKQKLEEEKIPNHENITVDTVERYQGSQRDVIIVSFSINNPFQLDGIINMNDEETVDRKLNVALTRAKEQLFLIGNDSLLSKNLIYNKFIEFIKSRDGYIEDTISDHS